MSLNTEFRSAQSPADRFVPDTWFLVGTAARLAIGMGLHCDATLQGLPTDQIERRKRLFLSVYMMDRCVFTIH